MGNTQVRKMTSEDDEHGGESTSVDDACPTVAEADCKTGHR